MPTLTLTLGKDYGRTTGELPRTADFRAQLDADGPPPVYFASAGWESPAGTDGLRHGLGSVIGEHITEFQGTPPVNGLSLHTWNPHTAQQSFSLIGVPLEAWVGHRIVVQSTCIQGTEVYRHQDIYDLAFITDPEYPLSHSPASIGPAHWHPSIDAWRNLLARVTDLEVERDLRKGAAAGSS